MDEVVFGTSGSTAGAKTIVRTERSLLADAENLVAEFSDLWAKKPLVVATVRPVHMYGALWGVRAPRLAGCPVAPERVLSVEELLALRRDRKSILLVTTPTFLELALAHDDFHRLAGAFAAIVTSGSMLRGETARAVRSAVGTCPLEIYGSTESGTVAWRRQSEDERWTLVGGVSARSLDDGRIRIESPYALAGAQTMSDLVDFTDARHFRLLGRCDRQVKILEHLVSLNKVESAIAASEFVDKVRVETVGDDVVRLGALIVLSPLGLRARVRKSFDCVCGEIRSRLTGVLSPHEMPRRLRFVRVLPVNAEGKVTVAAVRNALNAWCREPTVLSWKQTASILRAELAFSGDMECFAGHFPGKPILPGVAQLYFARHFARQVFDDFPDRAVYRKLKFKKVVAPGSVLTLTVERRKAGLFSFVLGEASSGEVEAMS